MKAYLNAIMQVGYDSYFASVPLDGNPHQHGTGEHNAWHNGWCTAAERHQKDLERNQYGGLLAAFATVGLFVGLIVAGIIGIIHTIIS